MMHKECCSNCGTDFLYCDNCHNRGPDARLERIEARFERLLAAFYSQNDAEDANLKYWWGLAEKAEDFLEGKRK